MKILITGGAGFIGTNFCHYMLGSHPDYDIVCLDKLTYASSIESLNDIIDNPHFRFVKGDICDEKLIDKLFCEERFDMVVNFAAESHVERSIADPSIFVNTNILGVRVLLDACRKYTVRFHQISTDEVYGSIPLDDNVTRFDENSTLRPSSPYSASKASADMLVMSYYRTYKLPVTISRCSNNYGPYQHPEKLIPLTIRRLLHGEDLLIHGDGLDMRDWLYVIDHCKAVDTIIHSDIVGEIYNISANNEISNINIMKKISSHMNTISSIVHIENRPCHDTKYTLDSSKISYRLGHNMECNFEETFANTIDWYLSHKSWFENK